jgi:hypothetical protein
MALVDLHFGRLSVFDTSQVGVLKANATAAAMYLSGLGGRFEVPIDQTNVSTAVYLVANAVYLADCSTRQ